MGSKDQNKKSPWEEFINGLDELNGLGKERPFILIRHGNRLYVEGLVKRYGMPKDDEAIEQLVDVLDETGNISPMILPQPFARYLTALFWETFAKNQRPLDAFQTIFLIGMAFGRLTDLEEAP